MVRAFTTDDERTWKNWINRNGGTETLKSYGFQRVISKLKMRNFRKPGYTQMNWKSILISSKILIHTWNGRIRFSSMQASIPKKRLEETDPYELIWIRDIFHNGYCGEKTVIFGHTRQRIYIRTDNSVYFGENRIIGIDGAAVYGGQLNCLQLPGNIVYSVKNKE